MEGSEQRPGSRERVRVLHVDDDADVLDLTATFLEREDERFHVETATRASKGLKRLAEGDVDCVVSDYDMPGLDGLEFLELVREDYLDLPFILFTGHGSESVASDAISAGVTDYLEKETGTAQYTILANRLLNAVDRMRVERERRRQLEAVETIQEGISILDGDERFIFVNEAYADLYGYEPGELIGESWEVLYPDGDVAFIEEEVLPTVSETGHWHGETTGLRADGTTFVEDHVLAVTEHDELVCTVRDVTDRKARERELAETNSVLRSILENLPSGILVEDADRNVRVVNDSFCELFDVPVPPDELVGQGCREVLGDLGELFAEPDEFVSGIEKRIERREPALNEEVTLANGRRLERDYVPYTHPDGDANLWIYRDVTERKDLQERYELVVRASADAFWDWDPKTDAISRNEGYFSQFGYDESDVGSVTDWWRDRIHPDDRDRVLSNLAEATEDPESTYDEIYRFRQADGSYGYLHSRGTVVYDDAGEPKRMVGAHIDVTERMEAQQKLERQKENLDEFAGVISHDLRNPLHVATGRLQLAQEECDSDHLDDVERALGRMESLIEDLLTIAREGERAPDVGSVDLSALVESCWRNVETADASLVVETRRTIRADEFRLKQLLENLIGNAVEHGGEDVAVRVGDLEDGSGFYLEDDGPGIPPDERDEVFESGYSTTAEGTGFGLAIVQEVAEVHGWEIRATEGGAGGARFEVRGVERD